MDLVDIEENKNYKFDKQKNQVININTGNYLKYTLSNKGFYFVTLLKDGKTKQLMLNYLIYKYNNQDDPDNLVDIDNFENYKFDKQKNQVINTNTGKYLTNVLYNNGYYSLGLSKNKKIKQFQLHRLVFKSHNPLINIEGFEIDHVDRNKTNNNIENLRIATRSENGCNIKVQKNNKSTGKKNIYKTKFNTFSVSIMKDGKNYNKIFKTLNEAIEWRNIKLKELHGNFASF